MAFLRFSRDKRGYEHFYLVESATNRRGKTRSRILYWFRTPPGVKVGRQPFDPEVRKALESQNPHVQFDWRAIVETPIPSADVERWRERRRAEKAEKAARQALHRDRDHPEDLGDEHDEPEGESDAPPEPGPDLSVDAAESQADALPPTEESLVAESAVVDTARLQRRRRRRRRGRGPRPQSSTGAPQSAPDAAPSDQNRGADTGHSSEPHDPE